MSGRDAARDELADDIDAVLTERMNRPDSIQSWDMDEDLYPIAEALLSRGYRRSVTPAAPNDAEPQWEIRVRVPLRLDGGAREALFDRVAEAVHAWEPTERDGWDADVSGGPEQDQARAFGLEVTE